MLLFRLLVSILSMMLAYTNVYTKELCEDSCFKIDNSRPCNREDKKDHDVNKDLIKQPLMDSKLESLNAAKIRILDSSSGRSKSITLSLNKNFELGRTKIALKDCKKNVQNIFNTLSMALIKIEREDGSTISRWIFSRNPSVSLPMAENNFIYLDQCEEKIDIRKNITP